MLLVESRGINKETHLEWAYFLFLGIITTLFVLGICLSLIPLEYQPAGAMRIPALVFPFGII
jgi:hypothetical protein